MRSTMLRNLALRRLAGLAIIVSVCALGATVVAEAAPMNGESVVIGQPDGSSLEVRVWGDEYFAHGETLDGYTVTRDAESGFLCYARLSGDGRSLISTGVPAGDVPPGDIEKHIRIAKDAAREQAYRTREEFEYRQQSTLTSPVLSGRSGTTTGDVVGITLIVDFSDDIATIPAANFDDYCNLPGYTGYSNNGSVRDYFYDVSEGLLTYTNYVPPQYYRAQNTKAYYTNPSIPYGQRAQELIAEALADLEASGFDFSQYDSNGDGIVDAVNCFYAGNTWNNWAEGLWPHAGWYEWCADGVCTQRYQITDAGSQLSLGTFCHENGHMLMGWPDLYDYGGESAGVGVYCLMCAGAFGTNPNEPCGHLKLDAGWADVTELWDPTTGLTASVDGNVMYRFERPGHPNEYFLLENRQPTGRDAGISDSGLAIWHIDTEGSNNNEQQTPSLHYLVTLVQADGDWDLENNRNNGDGTDLYHSTRYPECSPTTYPDTRWWDGSDSDAAFANISGSSSLMTFDFELIAFGLEVDAPVFAAEIEPTASIIYTAALLNSGTLTDTATLTVSQDELPAGITASDWTAEYRVNGGAWTSSATDLTMSAAEVALVDVRMTDTVGTTDGMALTAFTATSQGDGSIEANTAFATFVGLPSVLLVDDDDGASYESYMETALADTGYAVRTWDASVLGRPTATLLSSYWAVLWTTADGDATGIGSADEANIIDYLDQGGNFMLSSMEYLSSRAATNDLIQNYLHIDSWTSDIGCFIVAGVAADPISDGMSLGLLSGPFAPSLSDVISASAPAEPILTASGTTRGIRIEESGHKIVFLSFPFETVKVENAIPSNQRSVVARVLAWFEGSTGVADEGVVGRFGIAQNYPNPFNPVTKIAFTIPADAEHATLRIYDVAGRAVSTLVDKPLAAGPHVAVWDGTNQDGERLASGIYFARLDTDNASAVRKMTLLK